MAPFAAALLVLLAFRSQDQVPQRTECRAWQECRDLAAEADARKDYEAFHDLAWRAVQAGPKNDPQLLYALARAQSLSGRPGDALVMLQRLATMGVPNDAGTNDDFRRVRALPGWAAFHDALPGSAPAPSVKPANTPASPVPPDAAKPATPDPPAAPPATVSEPSSARAAARKGRALPAPKSPPSAPAIEPTAPSKPAALAPPPSVSDSGPTESLRFTAPLFTPAGLAYDRVSRRFIVGDRRVRKLTVIDEFSQHVANLASAQTAGFGEIAALEIDPRQGDLWVVSGDAERSALHKLQLISGRVLATFEVSPTFGEARFADVAVLTDGTIVLLDTSAKGRVFRLRPRARSLDLAALIGESKVSSLAPAPGAVAYVAHDRGLVRVDFTSRATVAVTSEDGVDLAGLKRIRWHEDGLVGVQQTASGYRAVRIRLNRTGQAATAIDVLDPSVATTDPTGASVVGDVMYYLASGEGSEIIVKKISLRKAQH